MSCKVKIVWHPKHENVIMDDGQEYKRYSHSHWEKPVDFVGISWEKISQDHVAVLEAAYQE